MNKVNFFPFERNRYYYGKQLNVNNFILEQEYINHKRQFINRYLHGMGVICGLDVIKIDENSFSLEAGAGIDCMGREIVVPSAVIKNISSFDLNSDIMYLCINYSENTEDEYYTESYSLDLTSKKPNSKPFYISEEIIYSDSDFCIKQRVKLFAESGEKIKFEVIVEKSNNKKVNFKYSVKLSCLEYNGSDTLNIDFNDSKSCTMSFDLYVSDIKDDYATIENCGDIEIFKDSLETVNSTFCIKIEVDDSESEKRIVQQYYNKLMDMSSKQESIYLAKFNLVKKNDRYIIKSIENISQYIPNSRTLSIMNDSLFRKCETPESRVDICEKEINIENCNCMMSSGEAVIELAMGGRFGQVFTSDNIAHGLGLGNVNINVGMVSENQVVYGSSEVFSNTPVKCETAVKLDTETGKFVIGIRLLENTTQTKVKFLWNAVKKYENEDVSEKRIFIQPSIAELSIMETCYFKSVFENIDDKRTKWSVNEQNGGSINSNGMYTAPSTPGIYEVCAISEAYPEVRTSVYVIVSDSK